MLNDELTASEALFAFISYLTTMDYPIIVGSRHDASPIVELLAKFIEINNLNDPREGWENTFVSLKDHVDADGNPNPSPVSEEGTSQPTQS